MKIDKAGFTLIELLLSTLIFSILVLSIAASFHSGILSYDRIDASFDTYQTARLVLSRISRDLSNSFSYSADDSKFSGDKQRADFFAVLDLFDEQGNTGPAVCRVIYEFDGDVLRRTLLKGIDALNPAVIAEGSEPVGADPYVCPLLKDISFEYAYSTRTYPDINRREGGTFMQSATRNEDAAVAEGALRQGRVTQLQEAEMSSLPTRDIGIGSNDPANEKAFGWQDSWPKQDAPGQKEILPLAVRIKLCLTQKVKHGEDRTVEFNKLVSLN